MQGITVFVGTLLGLFLWVVLGAIVLASVDDKQRSLFHWYEKCPSQWLSALTLIMWPAVVFFWYYYQWKDSKRGS